MKNYLKIFINLFGKNSVNSKKQMNKNIENYIEYTIKSMLNSGTLSMDIKNSLHVNNELDTVKLVFSKSPICFITIIFKFDKGLICTSIGELNGGENDIILFKNFFNTICEFSQNIKGCIEQYYKQYYNLSIQRKSLFYFRKTHRTFRWVF